MTLKEKQEKVKELSRVIDIYLCIKLKPTQISKATDLQNRLQFRLRKLEEDGADEKIKIMEELLTVLKNDKV